MIIATLSTPRRLLAAFLSGALMALAMAPVGAFPVLLLCVPAFILLTRTAPAKRISFLSGWLFGCGYFIFGLYWVSAALFVDIAQWGWVMPLSLVVGPAALALYYGLIPLAAWRFRNAPAAHALATVAAWSAVEWLRGHALTGFPWNLPGYAWIHALPVMQAAAVAGAYGLTLLTLLWASAPLLKGHLRSAVLASFIAVTALGLWRMHALPTTLTQTTVRIIQPNLPQSVKWDRDREWQNLEHTVALTEGKPVDYFIWPETAVTFDMEAVPEVPRYIALKMPKGAKGILGSLRYKDNHFYNSVSVLNDRAEITAAYDKHHLVPFGEYVPFRETLGITPIAAAISGLSDFTAGPGAKTIDGFSPLICYEAIFPRAVADKKDRPRWLVNVTNDGWYGKTAGPYQHFQSARMRAIEEGLPLARAANTGISGMIDPVGRVTARLDLATQGAIDAKLPAFLPPTIYARLGDWVFLVMLVFTVLLAVRDNRSCPKSP
jgi:apolipoprotein N-acyltransferase